MSKASTGKASYRSQISESSAVLLVPDGNVFKFKSSQDHAVQDLARGFN